ncbi:MAG TPA: outer membrane protein transport protein [Gemmatimonadaceae bacterium]|nr:outer membrane protein transport protein [Gemmatimonadaceae bacterium]
MQRHRSTRYLAVLVSLAVAAAATPRVSTAQGFGVNEVGTCAASRGFAVTGSPCQDASAIFWNPAATGQLKGWSILAGAAIIKVGGTFTRDTTFTEYEGAAPTAVVPHVFLNYTPANSKLSYGAGLYVPYGLTSQWDDSFPGRFQALKASLHTFYVQPNISYQLSKNWSIGAGPVIGHSSVELIQALDLSAQVANPGPPTITFGQLGIPKRTEFARARLQGDAMAYGAHVGVFGRLNDHWTLGARWLTPLEFEYNDADATFTQTNTGIVLPPGNPICAGNPAACGGSASAPANIDAIVAGQFTGGALTTQTVNTKITHPAQVQAGVGYSGFKDWLVSADYTFTGWRRFKELPLAFSNALLGTRTLIEDYNNTSSVRLGAQRSFTSGAALRVGFAGVASAAPDETVTPLLPEQDRSYASIGGSYPFMGRYAIEAAYLKVFAPGKRGRIDERTTRTQTAAQLNTGVYELNANVFSVSIKANY